MSPKGLHESHLWRNGPKFLSEHESQWPTKESKSIQNLPELKPVCCVNTLSEFELLTKFSAFTKLIRVFAYCLRCIHNSRKENCDKFTGYLSCGELQHSHDLIVKFTQEEAFHSDMHNLRKSSRLSPDSKLISLNPFIDKEGRGRLRRYDLL
jgi:hypothetical protein